MLKVTSCALLLGALSALPLRSRAQGPGASAEHVPTVQAPIGPAEPVGVAPRYDLTTTSPRPPSGLGGIIVGWAGLGVSAGALAFIPVCHASFYPEAARTECVVGQAIVAGGALVASGVGFIVGYPRRAVYRSWRATQRTARPSGQLTGAPLGAGLGYRFTF